MVFMRCSLSMASRYTPRLFLRKRASQPTAQVLAFSHQNTDNGCISPQRL